MEQVSLDINGKKTQVSIEKNCDYHDAPFL